MTKILSIRRRHGNSVTGAVSRFRFSLTVAAALLFAALSGFSGARAQNTTERLFEVRDVAVDVQAATASAAQAEAILIGRRTAWQRLVERLVPVAQAPSIPVMSDEELVGLTVGYEVARERTSDVRYLGSLNFRFNPVAVRRFFSSVGIGYAEVAARPILILPVYNDGTRPLLWEEQSPWLAAWLDQSFAGGLVPIVVPYGDLADIRDITAVQAILVEREAIEAISARYGAEQVLVASARTVAGNSGEQAVELNMSFVGGVADGRSLVLTVSPNPDEPAVDLLTAAARAAAMEIQEAWKTENLISPGLETRVTVLVPVTSFDNWLEVRKGIDGVSAVSRRELLRLSRNEALLDVWVNGDADQLALALKQKALLLQPWEDSWVLYKEGTELPEQYRLPEMPEETLAPPQPLEPAPAAAKPLVLPPLKP